MRPVLLVVMLALGLGTGWVVRGLGTAPTSLDVEAEAAASTGGSAADVPGALRLAGHADARAVSLAEEAGRAARALAGRTAGSAAARQKGYAALALLQAVSANEAEFLRVARLALESGATLDWLLPALREFPPEVAARLLDDLLDVRGGAAFDPVEAASLLAEGGRVERALGLVHAALASETEPQPPLLQLLLRLDPRGGPARLLALEGSERWGPDVLGVVRASLVAADQEAAFLPFLQRALATRSGDADLLRWLARLDPGAAVERLRARVAAVPEDGRAWALLADLRRDAGDSAGAFEAYKRAAELAPGRSTYRDLVRADPARGLALVQAWAEGSSDDERLGALGEALLVAGLKADAFAAFQRASAHDPNDRQWIERMIDLDPAAAAALLGRQVADAQGNADDRLLGRHAQALAAAGRTDEAFAQYLAAWRRREHDGAWQLALARTDAQRALPLLEERRRAHPDDAAAAGAHGVALAQVGRRDEAERALEEALSRGDGSRWYPHLARLDAGRALAALERRAQVEAYDADLWSLLGAELGRTGRREEALRAYEAALRLEPDSRSIAEALRALR